MEVRLKRRKDKYNPYTIVKMDNEKNFFIKFKDINKKEHFVKVTQAVYEAFNQFELEDLSELNKFDRHIEHSKLNEFTLNNRMNKKDKKIEDIVIDNIEKQQLYSAILSLPIKQKERIHKYYYENLTLKKIAQMENCSIRAIQYSMRCALKNLKKIIKHTS